MAIDRTIPIGPAVPGRPSPGAQAPRQTGGPSFGDALRRANEDIRLSRHAQQRVERRELDLDPERMNRLNDAISRAAAKGARSSVVVLDDLAVVVDVRERTIVTAMSREGGRDRVFTNVDSVVLA